MAIVWTKYWQGSDDGVILKGIDIRNIQDDLAVVQTVDDVLSIPNQTQGDILYFDGSTWVRLAAGTDGQVLKTQGVGANPEWGEPEDLVIPAQADGGMLYFDGTNWVAIAPGTAGYILQSNGAAAPTWVDPTDLGIVDFEAGTYVELQLSTTEYVTASTTYAKLFEFTPMARGGEVTFTWEMRDTGNFNGSYVTIYINGVAAGVEQSVAGNTFVAKTDTISGIAVGDVISVWGKHPVGDAWGCGVRSFAFKVANPSIIQLA